MSSEAKPETESKKGFDPHASKMADRDAKFRAFEKHGGQKYWVERYADLARSGIVEDLSHHFKSRDPEKAKLVKIIDELQLQQYGPTTGDDGMADKPGPHNVGTPNRKAPIDGSPAELFDFLVQEFLGKFPARKVPTRAEVFKAAREYQTVYEDSFDGGRSPELVLKFRVKLQSMIEDAVNGGVLKLGEILLIKEDVGLMLAPGESTGFGVLIGPVARA